MTQNNVYSNRKILYFTMDNKIFEMSLNAYELAVYSRLCFRSSIKQPNSWESHKTICDACKITKPTLIKSLKRLEELRIIKIEKRSDERGRDKSNIYWLLDVSEWQGGVNDVYHGSKSNLLSRVNLLYPEGKSPLPDLNPDDLNQYDQTKKKKVSSAVICTEKEQPSEPLSRQPSAASSPKEVQVKSWANEDKKESSKAPPQVLDENAATQRKAEEKRSLKDNEQSVAVLETKVQASKVKPKRIEAERSNGSLIWEEYAKLFVLKYRTAPIRNAKGNSIAKKINDAVGLENGLKLVAYYLSTNHSFYFQQCHDLALCLRDIHKLNTELQSGERRFRRDALKAEQDQQIDQALQKIEDVWEPYIFYTDEQNEQDRLQWEAERAKRIEGATQQ